MATTVRQPFAPLDSYRLKALTSQKNRQNAISSSSPIKRKAESFDLENDTENIDPNLSTSPKKSRGVDGCTSTIFKTSKFVLTAAPPSPSDDSSVFKPSCFSPQSTRPILTARSPLRSKISSQKLPLSTPAGRSPTRKRVGIMNRWKASSNASSSNSSFLRVDPPALFAPIGGNSGKKGGGGLHLPFTIDAALKGTIPSYGRRGMNKLTTINDNTTPTNNNSPPTTTSYQTTTNNSTSITSNHSSNTQTTSIPSTTTSISNNMSSIMTSPVAMLNVPELYRPEPKSSWFFDIHEDTPEEESTNLMYHSTLTLDISSDEESTNVSRADLRGKENIPPMNDRSQTYTQNASVQATGSAAITLKARLAEKMDIDRSPLGDLCAEEYYPKGLDATSTFYILEDEVCEVVAPGVGVLVGAEGKEGGEVQEEVEDIKGEEGFAIYEGEEEEA